MSLRSSLGQRLIDGLVSDALLHQDATRGFLSYSSPLTYNLGIWDIYHIALGASGNGTL